MCLIIHVRAGCRDDVRSCNDARRYAPGAVLPEQSRQPSDWHSLKKSSLRFNQKHLEITPVFVPKHLEIAPVLCRFTRQLTRIIGRTGPLEAGDDNHTGIWHLSQKWNGAIQRGYCNNKKAGNCPQNGTGWRGKNTCDHLWRSVYYYYCYCYHCYYYIIINIRIEPTD
jgi:hypothetical protein